MRMRSQVVRMRSFSIMRMRSFSIMRMRIIWLRMRIIDPQEIFENLRKFCHKTEFISARPNHQNVKKIRKFFLVKIIVSKVYQGVQLPNYILTYVKIPNWRESWHYNLT